MKRSLCAFFLLCSLTPQLPADPQWRLARDEQGIRIYLRTVPGSAYQAYRGEMEVAASIAAIRALHEDVSGSCRWVHACRSMRLLDYTGDLAWTYTRIAMPWPVRDRDLVLRVRSETRPDGELIRHLQADAGRLPEQADALRVQQLQGEWRLQPLANGHTRVIYQVQTEPGGQVPAWLANSFVLDAPFNTLQALRRQLQER